MNSERLVFNVLAERLSLDDLYDLLDLVTESPRELEEAPQSLIDDLEEG